MDPLFAAGLGALAATVVIGLGALLLRARAHRRAGQDAAIEEAARPAADAARHAQLPPPAEPGTLAGLVPLVFSPVHALLDAVTAASTEVRTLFAPGGEVGLVFSDIVGSTKLNGRLGDAAWAQLVSRHDELTGQVVRAHGGRVVKRQGDGFMAAFHDAPSAVAAALALAPALASGDGELARLRVRVGVHYGEVVTQQGDYFGVNVAMAARIAGAAAAGEVLVSQDVVSALGPESAAKLHPRAKPERLDGLPGKHRLVSVTA